MIVGIDHLQLAMPAGQEQAARKFYAGILGMIELPKPAHLAARGGAWSELGSAKIHLGVDPDFRPARKAHPGLLVADLKVVTDALRRAGYEVQDGEPLEGHLHAYVDDPFGNRLELMQRV